MQVVEDLLVTGNGYTTKENIIYGMVVFMIVVLFCWLCAFATSVISRDQAPTPALPNTPTVQAPRYFPRHEPMKDGDYKI